MKILIDTGDHFLVLPLRSVHALRLAEKVGYGDKARYTLVDRPVECLVVSDSQLNPPPDQVVELQRLLEARERDWLAQCQRAEALQKKLDALSAPSESTAGA